MNADERFAFICIGIPLAVAVIALILMVAVGDE